MKKIRVIVAAHKKYRMPEDKIYMPLHVGAKGKENIGYRRDDTGDNISEKNPFYCELTGLYWAWKNVSADYIGLAHYRRHFTVKPYVETINKDKFNAVLNRRQAYKLLSRYNIILPKKRNYYMETLYSHYAHTHYTEHLDETRKIIKKLHPEYVKSFDRVMKQKSGYMFNMMIMKRKYFDQYCEWLFSILSELEKRISMPELSSFQGRFYGRVSEIIFNVWLDYMITNGNISSSEIKEIGCIHMEKINWIKKGSSFIMAKLFGVKYKGSF